MGCIHHYLIDSSGKGKCKLCGEERQFSNHAIPSQWEKQNGWFFADGADIDTP